MYNADWQQLARVRRKVQSGKLEREWEDESCRAMPAKLNIHTRARLQLSIGLFR